MPSGAAIEVQLEAGLGRRLPNDRRAVEHELQPARGTRERLVPDRLDDRLLRCPCGRRADDRGDVEVAPAGLVRAEGVRAPRVDADELGLDDGPQPSDEVLEVGAGQRCASGILPFAFHAALASSVVGSKSGLILMNRSWRSSHSWYGDGRPQNQ